jgi:hypothetical protein
MHCELPVEFENLPTSQSLQLDELVVEVIPMVQFVQREAPVKFMNMPEEQSVHMELRVELEYFPTEQSEQVDVELE